MTTSKPRKHRFTPVTRDVHILHSIALLGGLTAEQVERLYYNPAFSKKGNKKVTSSSCQGRLRDMVDEADRHLLVVITEMRQAAKVAAEHGDPGTVDVFSRFVQIHEKHEWWMRDILRTGDGRVS